MTDHRVAIVAPYVDNGFGRIRTEEKAERLLSDLDAAMQSPEVVERVAKAIRETRYRETYEQVGKPLCPWEELAEWSRDDYRAEATAALAAAVGGTKP